MVKPATSIIMVGNLLHISTSSSLKLKVTVSSETLYLPTIIHSFIVQNINRETNINLMSQNTATWEVGNTCFFILSSFFGGGGVDLAII